MKRKVVALLTALTLVGGMFSPYGVVKTQAASEVIGEEII